MPQPRRYCLRFILSRNSLVRVRTLSRVLPLLAFAIVSGSAIAAADGTPCRLAVESIEVSGSWIVRTLPPDGADCLFSEAALAKLLATELAAPKSDHVSTTAISIGIGRLVRYPSISSALARSAATDSGWNKNKGRATNGNDNKAVARLLKDPMLMPELAQALDRRGYLLAGVSVEKVLVGTVTDIPNYRGRHVTGKLPYDVQVWFRLQPK